MNHKIALDDAPVTKSELVSIVTEIVARSQAELALMLGKAIKELEGKIEALREEMNAKFAVVDARFEAIERRFDQIDTKFVAVNARLEKLAFESVKHGDHSGLIVRVDKLERDVHKKR